MVVRAVLGTCLAAATIASVLPALTEPAVAGAVPTPCDSYYGIAQDLKLANSGVNRWRGGVTDDEMRQQVLDGGAEPGMVKDWADTLQQRMMVFSLTAPDIEEPRLRQAMVDTRVADTAAFNALDQRRQTDLAAPAPEPLRTDLQKALLDVAATQATLDAMCPGADTGL